MDTTTRRAFIACATALLLAPFTALHAAEGAIVLARSGKSLCQIVQAPDASGVDAYAAATLAGYLKEMTGAEFAVVTPDRREAGKAAIFVGLSEPARVLLEPDPLEKLRDQEHVARSIGRDILLYGKGVHGNLNAVMEFLENSLGWRWYSVYEKPVVPKRPELILAPFDRWRGFGFESRRVPLRYNPDFYLQAGVNMGLETELRRKQRPVPPPLVSWLTNEYFVHTSFSYIPPTPSDPWANKFPWVTKKDYFQTKPEFFSLGENGRRVPDLQLCYSIRRAGGCWSRPPSCERSCS